MFWLRNKKNNFQLHSYLEICFFKAADNKDVYQTVDVHMAETEKF